jgi:DNA polymerase eta
LVSPPSQCDVKRRADRVEKASIDEAFLDLTPMVIDRLLATHPYLAAPPPDAPEGLDSPLPKAPPIDWTKAGEVFPVNGEESEPVSTEHEDEEGGGEPYSSQRSDEEPRITKGGDAGATWEDWALCYGAEIMAEIRGEVWKRLHYTCSAVS